MIKMEKQIENPMREIKISKLTLNVGAGKDQRVLDRSMKLLKVLTGIEPVKTITYKRIQAWGLRSGLPIGCMITLRDQAKIRELLPRLLEAKENVMVRKMFDDLGNISFGIPECIDIADYKYDPEIGILGLQATITLTRPGYRIMRRKHKSSRINKNHQIKREESIKFMKDNFGISIKEEIEEE